MSDPLEIDPEVDLVDPDVLSPDELFARAEAFYNGLGNNRNIDLAVRWYRMASDRGHRASAERLRRMFPESLSWEESDSEATVTEITEKDEKEFSVNRGNPKPHELEVFEWYKREAEAGNPEAQLKLGFFLEEGIFGPKNPSDAVHWYRTAAKIGNLDAQHCMAACYRHGYGVEKSHEKMYRWLRRAAEGGHALSQYHLGLFCYGRGEGVEMDSEESAKWYRMASDQGFAPAMNRHGINLTHDATEENLREAFHLFRRAADLGDPCAMYSLHHCYFHGDGVEADPKKARRWLVRAARHGDANAQVDLANALFTGTQGMKKDFYQGARFFREQAKHYEVMAVSYLRRAVVNQWMHSSKI